jgi:hypothetical protein
MKNLLMFAVLVLSGCNPAKQEFGGNWTIVYVGEGDNVREHSSVDRSSVMFRSTLSFSESGDVQLLDANRRLLRTCKYSGEGGKLMFKECSGGDSNTDTAPDYTYEYEFESGDEVNLYSTDFKHVLRLERSGD